MNSCDERKISKKPEICFVASNKKLRERQYFQRRLVTPLTNNPLVKYQRLVSKNEFVVISSFER